jgi:ABC-type nitrate/sulfonate/bicarbonate transport system substrate-binding protein
MRIPDSKGIVALVTGALLTLAGTTGAAAQGMIAVDVVIGNNFGHLPMFVGVDKGFFKKHGVEVRLKVVSTGSEMVSAMQKREVQIGDMSVTTFLKARTCRRSVPGDRAHHERRNSHQR